MKSDDKALADVLHKELGDSSLALAVGRYMELKMLDDRGPRDEIYLKELQFIAEAGSAFVLKLGIAGSHLSTMSLSAKVPNTIFSLSGTFFGSIKTESMRKIMTHRCLFAIASELSKRFNATTRSAYGRFAIQTTKQSKLPAANIFFLLLQWVFCIDKYNLLEYSDSSEIPSHMSELCYAETAENMDKEAWTTSVSKVFSKSSSVFETAQRLSITICIDKMEAKLLSKFFKQYAERPEQDSAEGVREMALLLGLTYEFASQRDSCKVLASADAASHLWGDLRRLGVASVDTKRAHQMIVEAAGLGSGCLLKGSMGKGVLFDLWSCHTADRPKLYLPSQNGL